jgi:hypothetical protein
LNRFKSIQGKLSQCHNLRRSWGTHLRGLMEVKSRLDLVGDFNPQLVYAQLWFFQQIKIWASTSIRSWFQLNWGEIRIWPVGTQIYNFQDSENILEYSKIFSSDFLYTSLTYDERNPILAKTYIRNFRPIARRTRHISLDRQLDWLENWERILPTSSFNQFGNHSPQR